MSERTDRIYLAPDEPRCEPTHRGKGAETCARALAVIPRGGKLSDYSLVTAQYAMSILASGCSTACPWFLSAADSRKPAAAAPAPKPWPVAP